jgi:two-component system invasion response regulator UvrY
MLLPRRCISALIIQVITRTVAAQMKSIGVLIADDHPMIIQGLISALQREGVHRVGDAGTAEDVIKQFERTHPDVVVLDIRFGGGTTGLQVARELLARHPQARIVFYSQFDQDEIVKEAYRLGGMSFVSKSGPPDDLTAAIRQAHAGQIHFTSAIANRLALLGVRGDDSPQSTLEPRELEVFTCMAQGLTNAEIAERLGLSVKTISNTSQAIKEQLGVHRPADITLLAVKHGLITP